MKNLRKWLCKVLQCPCECQKVEPPQQVVETPPEPVEEPVVVEAKKPNPLHVPYFYQNDNVSGTGYRECFSSSCAMLAAYYGKVTSDDQYNKLRSKYGDTTSTDAHIRALRACGLKPGFSTKGSVEDLKREIDAGRPVAVGWLHKGSVDKPSGGGHWSVIIGYTDTHFIVHDPNGEASLVGGGYVNHTQGEAIKYSFKNWIPRWCVEGPNSGWYLTCSD